MHFDLARRYRLLLTRSADEDGFVAEVPDLPYLVGVGDTPAEAARDAVKGIAAALAFLDEVRCRDDNTRETM